VLSTTAKEDPKSRTEHVDQVCGDRFVRKDIDAVERLQRKASMR